MTALHKAGGEVRLIVAVVPAGLALKRVRKAANRIPFKRAEGMTPTVFRVAVQSSAFMRSPSY